MNDNASGRHRFEELVTAAVINAGCKPQWSPVMGQKPSKTININVEKAGALIVGGNSPVTINMGDEVASGTTIASQDAVEIESLVKKIADARSARPEQIKKELAEHMGIADIILLTKETVGEALTILRGWNERVLREAVNRNGTNS